MRLALIKAALLMVATTSGVAAAGDRNGYPYCDEAPDAKCCTVRYPTPDGPTGRGGPGCYPPGHADSRGDNGDIFSTKF
jgi:hypothetical protein